jgi:outer membrane protein assembly factor BamB
MIRFFPVWCLLLLTALGVAADEPDPEPKPRSRFASSATAGGYMVKVDDNGVVTGSDKDGRLLWKCLPVALRQQGKGVLAIAGDYVVVLKGGNLCTLQLATGKILWSREGKLPKPRARISGEKIILSQGARRQVIDLKTGTLLQKSP